MSDREDMQIARQHLREHFRAASETTRYTILIYYWKYQFLKEDRFARDQLGDQYVLSDIAQIVCSGHRTESIWRQQQREPQSSLINARSASARQIVENLMEMKRFLLWLWNTLERNPCGSFVSQYRLVNAIDYTELRLSITIEHSEVICWCRQTT